MRFFILFTLFLFSCVDQPQVVDQTNMSSTQAKVEISDSQKSRAYLEQELINEVKTPNELEKFAQENHLQKEVISGTLQLRHTDLFEIGEHIDEYFLKTSSGLKKIQILADSEPEAKIDKQVTFNGVKLEGESYGLISVNSRKASNTINTNPVKKRAVILLVRYNDSQEPSSWQGEKIPLTYENVREHLNHGFFPEYIDVLYQGDISKQTNYVHVEDWYTFNRNCADTHYNNKPSAPGHLTDNEVIQILNERNVDLTNIDHISIILNCGKSPWVGWGHAFNLEVNGKQYTRSFVSQGKNRLHFGKQSELQPGYSVSSFMAHFIHERIHRLDGITIMHSNGLDCGDNFQLHPCKNVTYGNPFDVMGFGRYAMGLNAGMLKKHNMRSPDQFVEIHQPGIYEIDPVMSENSDAKIGFYIKSEFSQKPVFLVEHRGVGKIAKAMLAPEFEEVRNGLAIMSSISNSTPTTSPVLGASNNFRSFDPQPMGPPTGLSDIIIPYKERLQHDAISINNPFFDPVTGIGINVLEQIGVSKNQKLRFQVTIDEEKRVCFKERIAEQIGHPFLIKYQPPVVSGGAKEGRQASEVSDPILEPGDSFKIQMRTNQLNPLYCPREKLQVEVLNHEIGKSLIVIDEPSGGGGTNPTGNNGAGNPFEAIKYFRDYNKLNEFSTFTLLDDAPKGDHQVIFKFTNPRTDESVQRVLVIKIR